MSDREKRKKAFGWLIALFSVYSLLLMWGGWQASGIAPSLMSRNYQSVQYASRMESSLVAIYLDAVGGKVKPPGAVERFQDNLEQALRNITEDTEAEILQRLSERWTEFNGAPVTPTVESFRKVASVIEELTAVNERAMLSLQEKAKTLRYTLLAGGGMGFVIVLLYAVQIAVGATEEPS